MIETIKGVVTSRQDSLLTVDIGFVSFGVIVPTNMQTAQGQTISLYAYMHWNQEQGPSLFGFEHELDKIVFLLIISCSGIGPKLAMAIISQLGGSAVLHAIEQGDEKLLSSVSGVGVKKAEQIVIQLKHKVAKLYKSGITLKDDMHIPEMHTVSEALQSLNYSRREIDTALNWLRDQQQSQQMPFDTLLRRALSFLSKKM